MGGFFICVFYTLILSLIFDEVNGQYVVEVLEKIPLGGHRPVVRCDATGANFGRDVMSFSLDSTAIGCALKTVPENACTKTKMARFNGTYCVTNFAVVPRGNCSFSEKAYYVQSAIPKGFDALIISDYPGHGPVPMAGSKFADLISIPVVMINYACLQSIMGYYSADKGYLVTLKTSPGYYELIKYLIPFVAIVGFCFVVLLVSLIIRLYRERRRLARKRLSRSNLKKIPVKKWRKGDPEETCAICLEDFVDGDKLRILLCKHAYHCKCVDPWLTKNRKVCPVCKRRVGPRTESDSSSDSDTERASPSSTRENDSLLRNAQPMATSSSDEFPYPNSLQPSTSGVGTQHQQRQITGTSLYSYGDRNSTESLQTPGPLRGSDATLQTIVSSSILVSPDDSAVPADTENNRIGRLRGRIMNFASRISLFIRRPNQNPHVHLQDDESGSITASVTPPITSTDFDPNSSPQSNSDLVGNSVSSPSENSTTTIRSAPNLVIKMEQNHFDVP